MTSIAVIGYGNPGRGDDGLGPAAAAELSRLKLPGVTVSDPYQLAPEDALDIANEDAVVFVDAAHVGPEPFFEEELLAAEAIDFDSHRLSPQTLLALAKRHFGKAPRAYLIGVRGYSFEFEEALSAQAAANLEAALAALLKRIRALEGGAA